MKDVAIVTGGAGYVGQSVVKRLTEDGYAVAILDINDEEGHRIEVEIKGSRYFHYDVTNFAGVKSVVDKIQTEMGEIKALVHCAGIYRRAGIHELDMNTFDEVMSVNCKGAICMAQAVAPRMQDGGYIVTVTAMHGRLATGNNNLAYGAAAAALASATRQLALELSKQNIKCTSLAPWVMDSPMFADEKEQPGWMKEQMESVLMDRLINAEDVSEMISFLASPLSYSINASEVVLDAGFSISRFRPGTSNFDSTGSNYYR